MQSVLVLTNGVSIQLNGVIFIKHEITAAVTSLHLQSCRGNTFHYS